MVIIQLMILIVGKKKKIGQSGRMKSEERKEIDDTWWRTP